MSVAQIILEQLGGTGRLSAMTGAHNFIDHGDAVSFKMKGRNAPGCGNYVKVTLNGLDLYDVEIGRVRKYELKLSTDQRDVPVESLRFVIEKGTGRYLSL